MQRCIDNNITRLFLPNVDAASVSLVYGLANEYPQYCYPMLGLHPCDVKENWEEELSAIMNAHQQNRIYAIGEIGIDLYWDKTHLKEQVDAFVKQINWAKSLDLAIVIH